MERFVRSSGASGLDIDWSVHRGCVGRDRRGYSSPRDGVRSGLTGSEFAMARIYRKTEYTVEERAEIQRIRDLPKPLETTGEKIHSDSFNGLLKLMAALRARREELGVSQA